MTARGTFADPLTFSQALNSADIQPGHTIWLKGGIYSGDVTATLNGTAESPILIKPYPGHRPIIDYSLGLNSTYLLFDGIEFACDRFTTRLSAVEGSNPTDLPTPQLNINLSNSFRHCIFHDILLIGSWENAVGAEFYGNLIYNWGWQGPDRAHGPGHYIQNGDTTKLLKHNIWCNSFWNPIQARTDTGRIDNLSIIENVFINAGSLRLVQGPAPCIWYNDGDVAQNPVVQGNLEYGCAYAYLWPTSGVENGTLVDNYFPNGITKATEGITVDSGNFAGPVPESGQKVVLRPDVYDTDRAILSIYNWDLADSVVVDVSAIFSAGDVLKAYSAQDYFGDAALWVVTGDGTVTVDMLASAHSVAAPVGWTAGPNTFPVFGAFVLQRQ